MYFFFFCFCPFNTYRGSWTTPAPDSIQTLVSVYFSCFLFLSFSHSLFVTGSSASAKEHAGVSGWFQHPPSRLRIPVERFNPRIYNGYRPLEEPCCHPIQWPLQFQLRKRLSWEGEHPRVVLWHVQGTFSYAKQALTYSWHVFFISHLSECVTIKEEISIC